MADIIAKVYVKVVEIEGTGELILERGQKVIDTKIIHKTLASNAATQYPSYKTIFVLSCVEYKEEQ